ncbi:MAG: hypothetical protein IKJ62_03905 [Alphaproteobacteria bacterium]|nr:hypothetical protein [Alphaproteobacteria bacterium]
MAQGKIINDSKSGNYVSGNKVFILDKFSSQTSNEQGFLNANDCLKYGLCDWVINDFGKIRTR